MDKDFHYYGTYVAACLAGYPQGEAQVIAHAAQYVDDSYGSYLLKKGDNYIDFQPIPTCQDMWRIPTSNDEVKRSIWVPFHFLPGNYKSQELPNHNLPDPNYESRMKQYTGPREDKGWFSGWKCSSRGRWQFKLMCLPQSPLVTRMINNTINVFKGTPYELYMAGIRMHVLADTGAHMYYAGTPIWHVNDVSDDVIDLTVKPNKKIPFGPLSEWCTTPGTGYESFNYLGHGRMGHIPDYPWLIYKYHPKWSKDPIVKDNPKEYLRTFKEMVTALRCIREGRTYNVLNVDPLEGMYEKIVLDILNQKHPFGQSYEKNVSTRCNWWVNAIKNLGDFPEPEKYDPGAWLNKAKQAKSLEDIKKTDYYKFNKAAIEHLDFVRAYLGDDEIPVTGEVI